MPERPLPSLSILVVEDDVTHGTLIREVLEGEGHQVALATSGMDGLKHLERPGIDLVVTDLRLTDRDGLDLVRRCQELRGEGPVPHSIVVTGYGSVEGAVQAMRAGALHYLQKPLDVGMLRETVRAAALRIALERQNRELHTAIDKSFAFAGILGETPAMQHVFDVMNQVVDTDATVLIRGESGTGKELVAQALHRSGPRRSGPFIPVNCAALAEGLLESELFGHERGAFTDARTQKRGMLETADGGTVFLDEIGEMVPALQAKLLRFLEEKAFKRVGASTDVRVDVRVIAATNRDLEEEVAKSRFRHDLFYRLNVLPIALPPLRAHVDDIPVLAAFFVDSFNREFRKGVLGATPASLRLLQSYGWPGNVRELRNVIERAMLLSDADRLEPSDFSALRLSAAAGEGFELPATGLDLEQVERQFVVQALKRSGGNQTRAAALLGLNRDQIRYRIEKFGLSVPHS